MEGKENLGAIVSLCGMCGMCIIGTSCHHSWSLEPMQLVVALHQGAMSIELGFAVYSGALLMALLTSHCCGGQ